jgi:NADPH:quinone reductase-like Zn-dependent oxidoreductase
MRAVRINSFGDASVLSIEDIAIPEPGPGEILVRVVASSVNPIEWKIRSGMMAKALQRPLPVTLGWDCAGVVEKLGAGVGAFRAGDAIFSYPEFAAGGTHAEYVTIKAEQAAIKPPALSFVEAAALPMTAGAAWQCVVAVGSVQPGQRVLIHGASGGVGTIAVQLAKLKGAHVIATASGANADLVRSLGADEIIDYRTTPFETVARDIDLVVDLVGGETQRRSWQVMRPGGLLVCTTAPPSQEEAVKAGVRAAFVFTPPDGSTLAQIGTLAEAGKIRPVIGLELPLAEARRAHEIGEAGGAAGKIVLKP